MNYSDWEREVPEEIRTDSLWKMEAYRLALFSGDIGWHDVSRLIKDRRTISLSDQLYRALGSISGNIEEGYSRGSGKDRARFYEYALGSARESRGWYYKGRYILGDKVVQHRIKLLTHLIRLLLKMIPHQRGYVIQEPNTPYLSEVPSQNEITEVEQELENLLIHVPLPGT
ncbi:MAG: four helix bundle protein [Calditrichaeota bacterium]|nr:MAG: four helix bundle protein [Calditrichota bacterium]